MIIKFKGQSWSNFIDWFFSCVKIFYQCERKFSINVTEIFQSMCSENFSQCSKNFNQCSKIFYQWVKIFNQCVEIFYQWAKIFNQWAKIFRQCERKISINEWFFSAGNGKNAIKRYLVLNKTTLLPTIPIWFLERLFTQKQKKRNWKKERFFIVLITKWLWLFRFLSKGKKQEKGEKRKKSKVCIFLL